MASLENKQALFVQIQKEAGKTEEEVQELIDKKKEKFSGLLTDAGALFMLAKELNVHISGENVLAKTTPLSLLEDGMTGIEIEATLKQCFQPKYFEKKGKKGVLLPMVIADSTGETRLTLWYNDVQKFEEKKIEKGARIILKNCYVSAFNDKPQLNVGFNGDWSVKERKLGAVSAFAGIKETQNDIDVLARVKQVFETKSFETQERKGQVLNFIISDGEQELRAVAWNAIADTVAALEKGALIKIEGAYAKKGMNGVELHLGFNARIIEAPLDRTLPELEIQQEGKTLLEMKDKGSVQVTGIVVQVFEPRMYEVCGKCKKKIEGTQCKTCGEIIPETKIVLNVAFDDGFAVARMTLFQNILEHVITISGKDFVNQFKEDKEKALIFLNETMLGKRFAVDARVTFNNYSEQLELIADTIQAVNTKQYTAQLLQEFE